MNRDECLKWLGQKRWRTIGESKLRLVGSLVDLGLVEWMQDRRVVRWGGKRVLMACARVKKEKSG